MRVFTLIAVLVLLTTVSATAQTALSAHFPEPEIATSSGSLAADATGGFSLAYAGYGTNDDDDQVVYAHCPDQECLDGNAWQHVSLSVPDAIIVQLALTGDGAPRLLVTSSSSTIAAGRDYTFLECDTDCVSPSNWRSALIATSYESYALTVLERVIPVRTFVLDAEDRPAFLFTDGNYSVEPDHYGAFLMRCNANCSTAENWQETDLALHIPSAYRTERFVQPVLAIAPTGRLGVAAKIYGFDQEGTEIPEGLYYYTCDGPCEDRADWTRTHVLDTGSGSYPSASWDLEFTKSGEPRIAMFAGAGMEQTDLDHELIYMWCNAACETEDAWAGTVVGPAPGDGGSPDLELTWEGQPRIAFLGAGGDLGMVACEENCDTDQASWSAEWTESKDTAAADRPVALPFTCDGEVWTAFTPSLVFAGRQARIAYDLNVEGRCLYKDESEPQPSVEFHELWRGVRVVTLPPRWFGV